MNFVNPKNAIKETLKPITLVERVDEAMYLCTEKEQEFNLQKLEFKQLAAVSHVFLKEITGAFNNPYSIISATNKYFEAPTSDILTNILYLGSLARLLKQVYYRKNSPIEEKLNQFFTVIEHTVNLTSEIYKSASKLLGHANKLKNSNWGQFKQHTLQYIRCFHELDSMLHSAFKAYITLQNNSQFLINIFDHYEADCSRLTIGGRFETNIMEYKNQNLDIAELARWQIDSTKMNIDMRKRIVMILFRLDGIIAEGINFKYRCLQGLKQQGAAGRVTPKNHEQCSLYFARALELNKLRIEMTNNISVRVNKYQPNDNFFGLDAYEDSTVPYEIRLAHFYILLNKNQKLNGNDDSFSFTEQILAAYGKSFVVLFCF
jgi:hypothetical protein